MAFLRFLILATAMWTVTSFAADCPPDVNCAPVTPLTSAQASALTPFAEFAVAVHCPHTEVTSWICGSACASLPGVETLLVGGDNIDIPFYFVAYYPPEQAIVHLEDADAILVPIDPEYFPGLPGVEVHMGFQATWNRTRAQVLAAVQYGIATHIVTQLFIAGHSLGAAIGLFEALYLRSQIPSSINITTTLFGLPRVGNQLFATHVDAQMLNLQHVVNYNDEIPHKPSQKLGYEHPSGEVWITVSGGSPYNACPGEENHNCADSIPLNETTVIAHAGPYAGVIISPQVSCNST